ncbi:MAG: amylo-alpha-1,6-glucosidase [Blastocatellia bacterium]|nr:amylo-alpha-1,6-glucosidase [Blastocatellia bacterium]
MIEFGAEICGNLEDASSREWLETNGLGGFASATITGMHTRRYHGLLMAATKPPVGRLLMLSKLEETLIIDGRAHDLSVNRYPGAIHPQGHRYQTGFRLDPGPTFTWEVDGVVLEKSILMIHGENTVVVQYRRLQPQRETRECRLEIRPLIAFRDYHALARENGAIHPGFDSADGQLLLRPWAELPALHLAHDGEGVAPVGDWYRNFEYSVERERGLDFREDLFQPVILHFDLTAKTTGSLIASTEHREAGEAATLREAEIVRRLEIPRAAQPQDDLAEAMALAADQFLVARGGETSVIAGYPWFADWGRDTMIALPGLTLTTGRFDIARSILREFARHVDRGMLPNRFPDAGETPEYNTVDATLWYFEAARALLEATGDESFIREYLYPVLLDIIDWHERGTRYNIHAREDGLLFAGETGVQLTWMDAKVGDWVVTPRIGLPVEIQALWHHALRVMADFAARFDEPAQAERFLAMAARAKESFNRLFWNEETGCLYDVIDGERRDGAIRPNQIFAVSLAHPILDGERARAVVDVVERDLLTPLGLRSLAPGDPQYIGRYQGGVHERDSAYHQGTVWAWLIGPFISAWLRVHGESDAARQQARRMLAGFETHLSRAGLGQVSEIFDGDAPHLPGGCIAQAWSVSEVLRALAQIAG